MIEKEDTAGYLILGFLIFSSGELNKLKPMTFLRERNILLLN